MLADGAATYGNEGGAQRAFGSTSLKTDGKIFAMLVTDRLVVKLPGGAGRGACRGGRRRALPPGARPDPEGMVVRHRRGSRCVAFAGEGVGGVRGEAAEVTMNDVHEDHLVAPAQRIRGSRHLAAEFLPHDLTTSVGWSWLAEIRAARLRWHTYCMVAP